MRIYTRQLTVKIFLEGSAVKPGKFTQLWTSSSGKSTLASVVAGKEDYEVTEGSISFEGEDIIEMAPEERAHMGLFLSFQYPVEIPGVIGDQLYQDGH